MKITGTLRMTSRLYIRQTHIVANIRRYRSRLRITLTLRMTIRRIIPTLLLHNIRTHMTMTKRIRRVRTASNRRISHNDLTKLKKSLRRILTPGRLIRRQKLTRIKATRRNGLKTIIIKRLLNHTNTRHRLRRIMISRIPLHFYTAYSHTNVLNITLLNGILSKAYTMTLRRSLTLILHNIRIGINRSTRIIITIHIVRSLHRIPRVIHRLIHLIGSGMYHQPHIPIRGSLIINLIRPFRGISPTTLTRTAKLIRLTRHKGLLNNRRASTPPRNITHRRNRTVTIPRSNLNYA